MSFLVREEALISLDVDVKLDIFSSTTKPFIIPMHAKLDKIKATLYMRYIDNYKSTFLHHQGQKILRSES